MSFFVFLTLFSFPLLAINLEEACIDTLRNEPSETLVQGYLKRISEIDQAGPTLNAIIELNPDALETAQALDREKAEKGPRGPLHGIPVLIKDNIATADKMETTAGSLALVGTKPGQDAFLVKKLRAAGAVILGKTNLSEWAHFRDFDIPSGWSGRGGQTLCPYVLDCDPLGSSTGSAVAVSANLTAVAVGTETNGSIVSPSAVNGIVGIKPTLGLISRAGIIPIAFSQDTAGPMARTVTDAAILLGAMTGVDPEDTITLASVGKAYTDYTPFLKKDALKGARIGILRSPVCSFPDPDAPDTLEPILQAAIAAMRQAGAEVIDPVSASGIDAYETNWRLEIETYYPEFKYGLEKYLASCPNGKMKTIDDIIAFNSNNEYENIYDQNNFEKTSRARPLPNRFYEKALETKYREMRQEGIDKVLQEHNLTALAVPTLHPKNSSACSSFVAAVAGYPTISIPMGWYEDLPVGLSLIGPAWSEPTLIGLAYSFEQMIPVRKPPTYTPASGEANTEIQN